MRCACREMRSRCDETSLSEAHFRVSCALRCEAARSWYSTTWALSRSVMNRRRRISRCRDRPSRSAAATRRTESCTQTSSRSATLSRAESSTSAAARPADKATVLETQRLDSQRGSSLSNRGCAGAKRGCADRLASRSASRRSKSSNCRVVVQAALDRAASTLADLFSAARESCLSSCASRSFAFWRFACHCSWPRESHDAKKAASCCRA
mmetsp:Transcript_4396/g.13863  ORF Transcript_4396/g.13863 Transcript_4396/m.13863 type:complete len:210 (-) Transcript_4396:621-1250(-)